MIAGVDPDDTADPAATRAAIEAASFVVSLELRETDVTRVADVVFPVAPVTDRAGLFVTWEGRPRPFDAVFSNPNSLPDLRVLSGIAEELGAPLGFRTVAEARAQIEEMGPWDGSRTDLAATLTDLEAAASEAAGDTAAAADNDGDGERLVLATWKQMIDHGSMQDGDLALRATARRAVALVSQQVFDRVGSTVVVTGDRGSMTLPGRGGRHRRRRDLVARRTRRVAASSPTWPHPARASA